MRTSKPQEPDKSLTSRDRVRKESQTKIVQLFPQDLGARRHVALVQRRVWQASGGAYSGVPQQPVPEDAPPPQLGRLGRMWAQGAGLTPEQAARALPAAGPMTLGLFWGLAGTGGGLAAFGLLVGTLAGQPEIAAILGGIGATLALPGLLTPGSFFRSLHKKPVGAADIENLLAAASGGQGNELERAYLNLVLTAIRQPAATPEAETDVRDALRALGEAIDHLPLGMGGSSGALLVDADALRREARRSPIRRSRRWTIAKRAAAR